MNAASVTRKNSRTQDRPADELKSHRCDGLNGRLGKFHRDTKPPAAAGQVIGSRAANVLDARG